MAEDDFFQEGTRSLRHSRLNEQALPEIAGGDTDRIELLDLFQHLLHKGRIHLLLQGDLLRGGRKIAVLVKIADDLLADALFILRQRGKPELPHEVVSE